MEKQQEEKVKNEGLAEQDKEVEKDEENVKKEEVEQIGEVKPIFQEEDIREVEPCLGGGYGGGGRRWKVRG